MSASEQPKREPEGMQEEDISPRYDARPAAGSHEVPLFLRGKSDERKGDAQDEKDEAGE